MFKKRPGRGVSIRHKVLEHEEEKEDTETAGVRTARTVGENTIDRTGKSVVDWVLKKSLREPEVVKKCW